MSECVECGIKTILTVDHSNMFAIKDYEYRLCGKCGLEIRRWTCDLCGTVFLGKVSRFFSVKRPLCPQCGKNSDGHVSAVLIPAHIRGNPESAKLWRNSLDDAAVAVLSDAEPAARAVVAAEKVELESLQASCHGDYLGGHPDAAKGEAVTVGYNASGLRVFSRKTGHPLFGIPWAAIARINHVLVPKGKPMDQASMTMALYGSSGRGGAVGDWAATLGAIGSMFDRDKHFVSIILCTPDGFEGAVGFEAKEGEQLANALTAERLRHGQSAAPPAQPSTRSIRGDVLVQIKELAALKEAGILTDDEFAAKKSELLARL
jgi:hypothetical protein